MGVSINPGQSGTSLSVGLNLLLVTGVRRFGTSVLIGGPWTRCVECLDIISGVSTMNSLKLR